MSSNENWQNLSEKIKVPEQKENETVEDQIKITTKRTFCNISPNKKDRLIKEDEKEEINEEDKNLLESQINDSNRESKINILQEEDSQGLINLSSIKCKIHGKKYLLLNKNTFSIICKKCKPMESKENIYIPLKSEEEEEELYNCMTHPETKGSFYCDDCKGFVCKKCFADDHRMHKCHIPSKIAEEFKQYIEEMTKTIEEIKPFLEENLEDLKKINKKNSEKKEEIKKLPSSSIQNISKSNEEHIKIFSEQYSEKMNGLDKEFEEDFQRYNKIKEKCEVLINNLDKFLTVIENEDNSKSNEEICIFHKSKKKEIDDIIKFIEFSENFLSNKFEQFKKNYKESKENLEKDIQLVNNSLNEYENTCISSIDSGRASKSLLIRRFIHFVHDDIKYFKATSLLFKCSSPIFLSGLFLCGLFVTVKKDPNFFSQYFFSSKTVEKLDLEINLYQVDSDLEPMIEKMKPILTEKKELFGIRNKSDPSFMINFNKAVKLSNECFYLINIKNLSSEVYCELWVGSTKLSEENGSQRLRKSRSSTEREGIQELVCTSTNVTFTFKIAEGIQTDFDEFNSGIISGLFYTV